MNNANKVSIIIILIGILITAILIVNLDTYEQSFINIVSIIGSVASVFGLIVAIIQIASIKKISEITSQAVQETKAKLVDKLSIADISKAEKLAREIQMFLRDEKYESAYLRLTDLKSSLLQFQASVSIKDYLQPKKYNKLVEQIQIDIVNLSDLLRGVPKDVDFSQVNNHLEQLVTVLSQFENAVKFHI